MTFKKGNKINLGRTPWIKGKTKENCELLRIAGKKVSRTKKKLFREGKLKVWNDGLTKEIDKRVMKCGFQKGHKLSRGKNNPFYGKHHTDETKEKIKKSRLGRHNSPKTEFKKGLIPRSKGKTKENYEPLKRISEKLTGRKISRRTREKIRKKQIELWKDKKHRETQTKTILKGLFKRPTSFEQKIINLIKLFNLHFKYVGNGQVIICYRNPDFIECNGRKLLIETYCKHWHPKNYEESRTKIFAKYGYKTLFLNEDDLCCNNWQEVCLNKINNFIEQGARI